MKSFDFELISKIAVLLIITFITGYAIFGLSKFNNKEASNTERIEEMIDKALVQCYALEGSYPSGAQFDEKMAKYGVVLNNEKYIYHYEVLGSNVRPEIIVIIK